MLLTSQVNPGSVGLALGKAASSMSWEAPGQGGDCLHLVDRTVTMALETTYITEASNKYTHKGAA